MNSKKYEVTGRKSGNNVNESTPIDLKLINSTSTHSLSTSPSVLYFANLDSGSPLVTIQTDESGSRQRLEQQQSVSGISQSKSSENLTTGQEYRRNLSDNSNQHSLNVNLTSSLFHRNLSEDQSQVQNSSTNSPKKSPTHSGLSSLTKLHQKFFKKGEIRAETILPTNVPLQSDNMCASKKLSTPTFISHLDEVESGAYLPGANVIKPFSQMFKINHSMSLNLDPISLSNHRSHEGLNETLGSVSLTAKNELYQKLKFLTDEEWIEIQKISYSKMKERLKLKTDLKENLKKDIRELNDKLVNQNTMIRSTLDIEKLRGEIRDLTNEKARLEMKFNQQSNWICQKCTYSNPYDSSKCIMCEADREDILICFHCGQKNSLSELSCVKCNAYFNVESSILAQTPTEYNQNPFLQRDPQRDSSASMSRHASNAQISQF